MFEAGLSGRSEREAAVESGLNLDLGQGQTESGREVGSGRVGSGRVGSGRGESEAMGGEARGGIPPLD